MKNPFNIHMEAICDQIRKGEPVGMIEALDAIEYQSQLQKYKRSFPWYKRIFSP